MLYGEDEEDKSIHPTSRSLAGNLQKSKKMKKKREKVKKISFWRLKKIEKRKTSSNFQKVH